MRNTLGDLNNHLFEQLERLNDEELKGEDLQVEIERAKAMNAVAGSIIHNASTVIRAQQVAFDTIGNNEKMPKMLEG